MVGVNQPSFIIHQRPCRIKNHYVANNRKRATPIKIGPHALISSGTYVHRVTVPLKRILLNMLGGKLYDGAALTELEMMVFKSSESACLFQARFQSWGSCTKSSTPETGLTNQPLV